MLILIGPIKTIRVQIFRPSSYYVDNLFLINILRTVFGQVVKRQHFLKNFLKKWAFETSFAKKCNRTGYNMKMLYFKISALGDPKFTPWAVLPKKSLYMNMYWSYEARYRKKSFSHSTTLEVYFTNRIRIAMFALKWVKIGRIKNLD